MKKIMLYVLVSLAAFVNPAFARDDDQIRQGAIVSISQTLVQVGNLMCTLNSQTEFESMNGAEATRASFSVGDIIKLKCRRLIAHELEMIDEHEVVEPGGPDDGLHHNGDHEILDDMSTQNTVNGAPIKRVGLKTRLSAAVGSLVTSRGHADFRSKESARKSEKRFSIRIKVPVPSSVPSVSSMSDARGLNLVASIARSGTPYAECVLRFDHVSNSQGIRAAEFKADVRSKSRDGRAERRKVKAPCDMDLSTDGTQYGVPAVEEGDTITITEEVSGEILSGAF